MPAVSYRFPAVPSAADGAEPPRVDAARRRWCVAGVAGSALLAARPAAAAFRVEITGVGATQRPIAVAPFRDEAAAGTAVSAVVQADLERSGVFRPIAVEQSIDERVAPDLAPWRARGADALVAGSLARLGDGRWDVRYKLWDAVRGGEALIGQSKVVQAADLRLAAHRIADEVYQQLTGVPGVFATRLAFVVRAGRRHTLQITDADGEAAQVALASNEPLISPAWAPDGRRLAYVSFEDQKAVVWVQDLASGARRRVAAFRGSNSAPAWSPDGQRLAVALSQDGPTQLYLMAAAGGTPERLTRSGAIDTEPVWSADGRQIYFVSDRGGGPQIYRVAVAGGGAPERVSFGGSYVVSPALSPDGRVLACIVRQAGALRLATIDLDSGTQSLLTDSRDDESPSFAPNGRLILYTTRAQGSDVLMTTTLDGRIKTRLLVSGADVREPAWGPYQR